MQECRAEFSVPGAAAGGDSAHEKVGMLVRNFELSP